MSHPHPLVILSGAGLSAASGIPTFRGEGGLWEGHDAMRLATPEAFAADPDLVRRFYDMRRAVVEAAEPNPGHHALAALSGALGGHGCTLITQNVDGLLEDAGAQGVVAMHGTLRRLRCHHDATHPHVEVTGPQDPAAVCTTCGGPLRPAVVWFGELPLHPDRIGLAVQAAGTFVAVGTSGVVYPAAGLARAAHAAGAHTVEINPDPTGAPWFDEVIAEPAETALPRLVDAWTADARS